VKAVLNLAGTGDTSFLANLVDRPFLRHIVEFVVDRGVREILVVGTACEHAELVLGNGCQWGASIEYRRVHSISDYEVAPIAGRENFLLVSAASLPQFPLRQQLERAAGAIIYGPEGKNWTGWAVIEAQDAAWMPPLCDHAELLSYLQALETYAPLLADVEFRCSSAEELWKSHQDALHSNLSHIFHGGLEVKSGVWIARNVSVASSATITAPAYIGENSRIGAGAQIGPFAVIAKDCLIAPGTIVRHAVVAPGTYAGNNLKLDHVLVNKRHLSDVRFGVSVERVDSPILDGVFDFDWAAIPRWVWSWLTYRLPRRRRLEAIETSAPDDASMSSIPSRSNTARLKSKSASVAAND
jgi:hypothetical protein